MYLEGKMIGNRYEIIEKIGTGGMATVYKAKCHVLNRYVAIKILRDEFTTDEEFVKRFNTEAQSAASLTHPNIVAIYDVGHEENLHYIVMELIQGKTLKQIIEEDGTLPWKWSVNIAIQIASALEVAHKNGIIHRDIKPHNIIITEDGVAKVMDFGIAKAVSNSTITAFGTTIGSVHYFSPEHAKGGFTDRKSDIYSLGVVMYEMLTGRVPFDADTPVSIALKHMQEKPVDPMKLNPTIPFAVSSIILKAMKKEPTERYESATAMLRDLTLALKNPEGDFVEEIDTNTGYTQVIKTLDDEAIGERYSSRREETKKKNKFFDYLSKHPKVKILLIMLICLMIPVSTFFITKALNSTEKVVDVEYVNVIGMTKQDVIKKMEELGLEVEFAEEYNSEIEKDRVITQDPEYKDGMKVKKDTKIKILLSKGTEITKVPKIEGLTYQKAIEALESAKLKYEKLEDTSKTVEAGYIIRQEPKEGTEANAGDTVKVYVSMGTGIKEVTVPYVLNKPKDIAKKELEEQGLRVEIVEEENTMKSEDVVLKQSIEAGNLVEEGSTIIITVNKIEKLKQATVNISLASIVRDGSDYGAKENEEGIKEVNVRITVNDVEVYNKKRAITTQSISEEVEGKGLLDVRVYIGNTQIRRKQIGVDDTDRIININ